MEALNAFDTLLLNYKPGLLPQYKHLSTYSFFFLFFKKVFGRTHVLFWGHWYPCFGFLVTSPLGLKARVGSALFPIFCGGECNVHSPRFTSGATLADLLVASSAAGHFPTCISRGGTWLRFERATAQTEDERATIVPATWLLSTYSIYIYLNKMMPAEFIKLIKK